MKSNSSVFFASLIACSLGMSDITPDLAAAFRMAIGIELPPVESARAECTDQPLSPDTKPAVTVPLIGTCSLAIL